MKKYLLCILTITWWLTSKTQPLITDDMFFKPGFVYTVARADTLNINEGNFGENQVYDFSNISKISESTISAFATSDTLIGYSSFPNANVCLMQDNVLRYLEVNDSMLVDWGNVSSINSYPFNLNCSIPIVRNTEKLVYNSILEDTAHCFYHPNIPRIVLNTIKYDGYGKLILPNIVYDNVVRLHSIKNFYSTNNPNYIFENHEYYEFYASNISFPVVRIYYTNSSNVTVKKSVEYLLNIVSATNEFVLYTQTLSLHPNPTTTHITLTAKAKEGQLLTPLGKVVSAFKLQNGQATLDVSGLPNGLYFLKTNEGQTAKVLVQH